MKKLHELERLVADYGSVCIGYSGGVDSTLLAVIAVDVLSAECVLAVTGRSASYPDVQWQVARTVAAQFGIPHLEIATDELSDPNYLANPVNRCYFCKTELWSKLADLARTRGLAVVIDGSNADDAHDHRPGTRAARERGVASPLMAVGLTKAEIRELSRARGLPTWDQPAAPCLSSRLPYGLAVTPERLRQVEAAEEFVRTLGIREFRVRHHGSAARLEIARHEMQRAIAAADALVQHLRILGFERVLLDVDGYRSGSLNESLPLVQVASGRAAHLQASAAGAAADIAVVDAPFTHIDQVRAAAADLRQAGFRYVALDLSRSSLARARARS